MADHDPQARRKEMLMLLDKWSRAYAKDFYPHDLFRATVVLLEEEGVING